MMKHLNKISKLVNGHSVHQAHSGKTHRFVDISVIEAEGRFFVRQYKFGKIAGIVLLSKNLMVHCNVVTL